MASARRFASIILLCKEKGREGKRDAFLEKGVVSTVEG